MMSIVLRALLIAIVAAELALALWSFFRGMLFLPCQPNGMFEDGTDRRHVRLLILIPCLREQGAIVATLQHLSSIFPADWCDVAAVTTAAEQKNEPCEETTQDVVNRYLAECRPKGMSLCHYPFPKGFMAHQLNYAIGQIGLRDYDYVAVYNADSRPSPLTYRAFLHSALKGAPVIQGYSAMTANYDMLSPLMKAFAIYQTNYEIKTGLLGAMMPNVLCSPHVVGHGLFIKSETLVELGLFNTDCWCEDIFMSLQLQNKGIDIEALPVLEEADAPTSLRSQLIQYSTWAKTALGLGPFFRRQCENLTPRGRWQLFQRDLRSFTWLTSSPLIVMSFFLSFVLFGLHGLGIALSSFLLMCASEYGMTVLLMWKLGVRKRRCDLCVGLLMTPVARLLASLGPMLSFFSRTKKATPK